MGEALRIKAWLIVSVNGKPQTVALNEISALAYVMINPGWRAVPVYVVSRDDRVPPSNPEDIR